jgi:predicted outer membrane protein
LVSRRWIWGVAGAAAVLWLARAARAETEAEYLQGPFTPKPPGQGAPAPAPRAAAKTSSASAPKPAARPARAAVPGYAAESARTATRLPPDERHARDFLRVVSLQARFETEAARLAMQRAEHPGVLAFAGELLDYHQAADAELLHLLAARGMAPPMMDNAQRKVLNRLARLNGARFDREFMDRVGRDRQRDDVQRFEKAAKGVTDPALLDWIDRQLPSLRAQHTSAVELASSGRKPRFGIGGPEVRPLPVRRTSGGGGS